MFFTVFCKKCLLGLKNLGAFLVLFLLSFYKTFLSGFLGSGGACRFYPSCSEYALIVYKKKPFLTASFFVLKRLWDCRPFGPVFRLELELDEDLKNQPTQKHMSQNKENFLDTKSLISIGFLIASLLAWHYYMRQKYPPSLKKEPAVELKQVAETSPKKPFTVKPTQTKEKTLSYKGQNMEILFSSQGFGIKSLKLKKRFARDGEQIQFHQALPLFSTSLLNGEPLPFEIQKQGELFVGEWSSPEGRIKKTISIKDSEYLILSQIQIEPQSKNLKGLSLYFSHPLPKKNQQQGFFKIFFMHGQELFKAFVAYNGTETARFDEKDLEKKDSYPLIHQLALGGKYFGKAFINQSSLFPSAFLQKKEEEVLARLDYELPHFKNQEIAFKSFLGPKSFKNLKKADKNLEQWLDFGFFSWLARPLLLFLNQFYSWCHNWGFSIILLTLLVRLLLLPLNIKSYQSMKAMQKLQPQIKELKEIHKEDPKKMNTEVMSLMKKHKANPLGGCLPLFIQFPIFFALYRVLGESIELYQSPFIFWIKDLSLKDPYYVFPILGGLILFVQQKITPKALPKEQARLIMFMSLLFPLFMLNFPSGLTLYIFVSGFFGLIQQFFFVKLSYFKGGENVKTI